MARQLRDMKIGLASELGVPAIAGMETSALSFPAFRASEALTLRPELSTGALIRSWALGLDLYIPQPVRKFVSLLQTGSGDGDLFLRDNGDGTAGLGVAGVYDGAVPFGVWTRLAVTVTQEGGNSLIRKYIDGALAGTQDLGVTDRWAIDPAVGLKLFTDNDGETAEGAVSAVFFSTEVPGPAEVAELLATIPTPVADGFFAAQPNQAAVEINFDNDDVQPRYGSAAVVLDGFGFGTPVAVGDSIIGFPSQLGLDEPGGDIPVLKTPGFAPDEGLVATIPLEADDLSTYTAVWDVYLDAFPGGFLALLQTDPLNANDGDLFVRSDGGLGIDGIYDGSVPVGAWTRIAISVEDKGDGTATLSKYIDGALVGTQTVDAQRFTLQSNSNVLLLTDDNGETGAIAIAHFGVTPKALSETEIAALGGVDADGPFDPAGLSEPTRTVFWSETFDGLPLQPFRSPTESGGDGTDWTDVAPAGWSRDNTTTPIGNPAEFQGWTFLDKASWIATAGDQERDSFTRGQGTVAVADPDEYDDGTDIDPDQFDVFLTTPEIDLTGQDGSTLQLAFDSSFRPYDGMTGAVEVSFDGGTSFSPLLTLDAASSGGDSALDRANERVTLDVDAMGATGAIFRWSLTDGGNDWWWAIDNIALATVEGEEPAIRPVRLTEEVTSSAGSLFTKQAVDTAGLTFESQFSFRIVTTTGAVADGITFQIQTERPGVSLLGPTAGGFLGLPTGPFPGVTIAFDTWQNTETGFLDAAPNQIRLFVGTDADSTPVAVIDSPVFLGSGDTYRAWVDYDGSNLSLFLADTDVKPAEPILSEVVDLSAVLGETAKFGFSGATGGSTSIHDILSWKLLTNATDGPSGQLLSIDQDAVDLLGTSARLAPLNFDKDAPLQIGFDGLKATVEFGFSAADVVDEPTVVNPIVDLLLAVTGDGKSFDLADVFGPDATNFAVISSNGAAVGAEISDGVLVLTPGELGHADITVTATSANGATLEDNFRAIVAGENAYVFAVIPDTQDYTSNPAIADTFGDMTDWLLARQDSLAIEHVIHVGDIVQFGAASQWLIAEDAMERLDGQLSYTLAIGNHDQQRPGFSSAFSFETDVDAYFTPEQVGATAAQGGGTYDGLDVGEDTFGNGNTYEDSIRNHYSTLETRDGVKWLIFSLEFGMPDDVLRWASEVIEDHLDHRVIIDTHSWNGGDGRITPTTEALTTDNGGWGYAIRSNPRNVNDGEDAWRELASKYPNVTFTFNGHNFMGGAETVVSYGAGGNPLHQIFVNYQDGAWFGPQGVGSNGGNGAMRLVVIDPDNDRITTHTQLVALDTYFEAFPDHQEVFEGVDLGAPEQIAIAKAGETEIVSGDGITATVTLDPSETIGDTTGADFAWFTADGEKLGETDGAPLSVDLKTGTNRLVLTVTDQNGNVSVDEKVVIVEAPGALLTETFDDGDAAGWGAPAGDPADLFELGTDLGFSLPSIGGVAQIPLTLRFDSSFRPYDAMTGEVLVSFDGGQTFSNLLTLDTNTVPGGASALTRANEQVTLEALVPNSASTVQFAWRLSQADNDWWWAIDNVAVSSDVVTRLNLFTETFDGLPLLPFQSPTESGGGGADWTDVAPTGWSRDNTTTPIGNPVEFRGWTFLDKASWIATAGNQARDSFTRGQGTVAVADPDEYDDGTDIDPDRFDVFLTTPEIDLSGQDGSTVQLAFDSSFRPYDGMTGAVEVSFDGGATFATLLTLDAASSGGDSALDRANERVTLDVDAAGATGAIFRFGLTDGGNDWWWAIDNIAVSVAETTTTAVLSESFDGLALQDTVDEADPGRPVWTPIPPPDWTQEVAPTTSQGSTEFQGWTFLDKDFWIATAGNQARDTFTLGQGNVAVADPDEWDDANAGAAGDTDEFDSTLATPAIDITGIGGGQPAGSAAGVLRVPALSGDEGLLVTPTGSSGQINNYTIIFDILASETTQSFSALFQTDVTNSDDAEIYLRNDGATASIGISGNYDGALAYGDWGRVALVFETDGTGEQTLSKYLDGVFLDSQVVDADVSDGSRWTIDADQGFLLFSEADGFTSEIFANAVHFTPEVLDAAGIAALGGVDVDGPVAATTNPGAFQFNFDAALDSRDYGTAGLAPISRAAPGASSYLVKGSIFGNPDGEGEAALYQQTNGANEILLWLGAGSEAWSNYVFDMVVEPADNDTIGAVFYYQNDENFYQLTLDQQNDIRTLSKFEDGVEIVLATETASYRHFAMQDLRIAVLGGEITITLDDDLLFDAPVVDTSPLAGGTVGLLSRLMDRVSFDNISVNPIDLAARALTSDPAGRWATDLDGDGLATVALTAAASLAAAGIASYAWLVDGAVVATGGTAALDLAPGETTVVLRVTDNGGATSEDRITVEVADNRAILVADDFEDGNLAGWTVVDEGTLEGPSDWQVVGGALVQASNINSPQQSTGSNAFSVGGDGPFILRDGTYALWNDPAALDWTGYAIEATITPNDDDGIGLLFRYTDPDNYYKLEADAQTGLVMLTRHLEGRETILARGYNEYTPGESQNWRIEVQEGVFTPYIDGKKVFGTEIEDRELPTGTVGLYSWGSENLTFDNVVLTTLGEEAGGTPIAVDDTATTNERMPINPLNVLGNDSDPDGDTLGISRIDTTGTLGEVTDNGDGTLGYDPGGAFDLLVDGETATDTFRYTISDGTFAATATVTITIEGRNGNGDGDGDGIVGSADIGLLQTTFGLSSGDAGYNPVFDFDGDKFIGPLDVNVFSSVFGTNVDLL